MIRLAWSHQPLSFRIGTTHVVVVVDVVDDEGVIHRLDTPGE